MEDRIRWGKALGLEYFPFSKFSSNSVWLMVVMLAQDLLAWAQRLCLEGPRASAEPKRLRYALWHTPGRLVRTARRLILRLDASWPWARVLARAFQHLRSLPLSP